MLSPSLLVHPHSASPFFRQPSDPKTNRITTLAIPILAILSTLFLAGSLVAVLSLSVQGAGPLSGAPLFCAVFAPISLGSGLFSFFLLVSLLRRPAPKTVSSPYAPPSRSSTERLLACQPPAEAPSTSASIPYASSKEDTSTSSRNRIQIPHPLFVRSVICRSCPPPDTDSFLDNLERSSCGLPHSRLYSTSSYPSLPNFFAPSYSPTDSLPGDVPEPSSHFFLPDASSTPPINPIPKRSLSTPLPERWSPDSITEELCSVSPPALPTIPTDEQDTLKALGRPSGTVDSISSCAPFELLPKRIITVLHHSPHDISHRRHFSPVGSTILHRSPQNVPIDTPTDEEVQFLTSSVRE